MSRVAFAAGWVAMTWAQSASACCPVSWNYEVLGFSRDGRRMAVRVEGLGGLRSMDAVRLYGTRSSDVLEERRLRFSVDDMADDGQNEGEIAEDPERTRRILDWARHAAPVAARGRPIARLRALSDGEPHVTIRALVSEQGRGLRRFMPWHEEECSIEPADVMAFDVPGEGVVAVFASYGRQLLSEPVFLGRAELGRLERTAADAAR
jgi:hypothetical protein